ncbi:MAG TPA: hypothetical protein VGA18_01665, partial [Rhodothermales bacterium]
LEYPAVSIIISTRLRGCLQNAAVADLDHHHTMTSLKQIASTGPPSQPPAHAVPIRQPLGTEPRTEPRFFVEHHTQVEERPDDRRICN